MGRTARSRIGLLVFHIAWLVGCATQHDESPTLLPGDRGAGARARIEHSVLHAAHASAQPAVGCDDCHERVGGEYLRAKSWPCQRCHATSPLALHAAASIDSSARECWTCHDFTSTRDRTTPCASCHAKPQGALAAIRPHDPAAASEDCGACHRAHQQPSLTIAACDGCHHEPVSGHDKPDVPISGCGSCHGYHEVAALASDRCTNCHRQSRAYVPPTATFSNGHVKCTTCHRSHRFVKTEVVGCRDACHEKQVALAETKVKEHRCLGCHDNHDVRNAALPLACETKCHANKVRLAHPRDRATKSRCIGCHKPHAGPGAPLAVACSTCHQGAASDRAFHQGKAGRGPQCRDCHKPHDFVLEATGVESCRSCHGDQPFPQAPTIRTHAKHADCFACHGDAVRHQPTGPRVACATCHRDQPTRVRKGHAACVGCHDPHTTQQRTPCATCHAAEDRIARKDHKRCINCHEPHDGKQRRACATCHAAQATTAPPKHQDCTSCHDQHSTLVKRPCGACHADRTTGVHAAVSCRSCHRPHGPTGPAAPPACTTCHTNLPMMHQVRQHQTCATCHRSHGPQPYRGRAACLTCHADRKDHEPAAPMCFGCHNFGGSK